ncbi:uncharacterized protein LOC131009612 [Salvia miltiorrhiza]|uniref:uncharacterized protein LOC131009612 n=1 Tax=Salvia miltiorrhiza TaxID=226208 RepID=UPI0025AB7FC0|nr:uncharacterized protein LOC131009612 [Salvia miltiorrhiza]
MATGSNTNNNNAPPVPTNVPHAPAPAAAEKPEKFAGSEFKRWQSKMLFYLTTLNMARFVNESPPTVGEDETDSQLRIAYDAWHHSDFLCRNYILNGLDNTLYNVYSSAKTSKELWDSLETKYKAEDAGLKKFIVGRFLDFKMVDSKTVVEQVQEFQLILHDILAEDMELSESFQMGLEDLIVRLRIEEDNRISENKTNKTSIEAKANLAESSNKKKRKFKGKHPDSKGQKRIKGDCFNCGKPGHMAKDCRKPKKDKHNGHHQAHVTETKSVPLDLGELDLCAVVDDCYLVV